jgi:hypothetical protein
VEFQPQRQLKEANETRLCLAFFVLRLALLP